MADNKGRRLLPAIITVCLNTISSNAVIIIHHFHIRLLKRESIVTMSDFEK